MRAEAQREGRQSPLCFDLTISWSKDTPFSMPASVLQCSVPGTKATGGPRRSRARPHAVPGVSRIPRPPALVRLGVLRCGGGGYFAGGRGGRDGPGIPSR